MFMIIPIGVNSNNINNIKPKPLQNVLGKSIIEYLLDNLNTKNINVATLLSSTSTSTSTLHGNYYAALKNKNPIKNKISLKHNLIITGPNASGKTTILKSGILK